MADNVNPVSFEVDGLKPREVLEVNFEFKQSTDTEGQPNGLPRGGLVKVKVKALNDGNNELLAWMLEPTKGLNFNIIFNSTVDGKEKKKLIGTNAYCCHFHECWEDKMMHYEEVTLTCQEIHLGSADYVNLWG